MDKISSELIELLEYAKMTKKTQVKYLGKMYDAKDYKFKRLYTIYAKNDEYITEFDSLDELQRIFKNK